MAELWTQPGAIMRGVRAAIRSMFAGATMFAVAMGGPLDAAAKGIAPADQAAFTQIRRTYDIGSAIKDPVRVATTTNPPTTPTTTSLRRKPGYNLG